MSAFPSQSNIFDAARLGFFNTKDRAHGMPIKAFHDVDESRRAAMRQAFEKGVGVSAIAKHFELSEREVWAAVKNDRSIGRASDERV
jgi:hypothetical protein